MSNTPLGGGVILWPPCPWMTTNAAPGVGALTAMTLASSATIQILTVPKSGTIAYIGFRCTASTLGVVTVLLQTVNSSGQPSGTLYGGSTASATQSVAANTAYELALGTPATAVEGDLVALMINYSSGTTLSIAGDSRLTANFPFSWAYNGTTYTASSTPVCCTLGYSSIAGGGSGYVPVDQGSPAVESYQTTVYNSGTTAFRRALQITPPCDMTVEGFWVWGAWAASSSLVINVYQSNGTNTSSSTAILSCNANLAVDGFATTGIRYIKCSTGGGINLTHGVTYYVSMEPQNTNNFTDYEMTFSTVAWQYSNPINNLPAGTAATLATGGTASGGSITWTPTATRRPLCGLLVSGFQQTGGGSSPVVGQGLSGGFN